jgi:hypothetical protein
MVEIWAMVAIVGVIEIMTILVVAIAEVMAEASAVVFTLIVIENFVVVIVDNLLDE